MQTVQTEENKPLQASTFFIPLQRVTFLFNVDREYAEQLRKHFQMH